MHKYVHEDVLFVTEKTFFYLPTVMWLQLKQFAINFRITADKIYRKWKIVNVSAVPKSTETEQSLRNSLQK